MPIKFGTYKKIPIGAKIVGCKWVYKTKCDFKGNVERYKARFVAKGFTQREGINYNETFSPVSCKDSFRIIMVLVAHFDLELHQMDVKTAFLNGDLNESVYLAQPKDFVMEGKEHMGCRLKKSIYGLKQASRQWYLKFDETVRKFGFKEMRRTITFMQSSRMENLFSLTCMWMIFCLPAVISICYWRQRNSYPQNSI